jgi:quinol monooxygenase YgiN
MQWNRIVASSLLALAACSSATPATPPASPEVAAPAVATAALHEAPFLAIMDGMLAGEVGGVKSAHDAAYTDRESHAIRAGNVGHRAFLGAGLLGTSERRLLMVDRWRAADAARTAYASPHVEGPSAALFAGTASNVLYQHDPAWHHWGTLESADRATARRLVVIRGRLAAKDAGELQHIHDVLVVGGQPMLEKAGCTSHLVFHSLDDPRLLMVIEAWSSPDAIGSVLTNPDLQAGMAPLFEGAPEIEVFTYADWHPY